MKRSCPAFVTLAVLIAFHTNVPPQAAPSPKPQTGAEADIASRAAAHKAELAKERERLVVPAAPHMVAGLARHYTSKELGDLEVRNE